MKNTDLNAAKEVAKLLLYLDIKKTKIDFILDHPFIYNRYSVINNKNLDIVDVLASRDNLNKAREVYEDLIDKADHISYILMLINKPYRSVFFKMANKYMSVKDYAELLECVWTDSENPNQDVNVSITEWISYFKKADKKILMSVKDYEKYDRLKENKSIIIYRGVGKKREPYGLSWTDELSVADWFANRWGNDEAYILKMECDTKNILAYFNTRGEKEIVVNMNNIDKNKIERIE